MRKLIASLAVVGALAGVGAAPATAVPLPDAACNQGTMRAHEAMPEGAAGHPHVPHRMMGMCMTMSGHP